MKIRELIIKDVLRRHRLAFALGSLVAALLGSPGVAYLFLILLFLEVILIGVGVVLIFVWPVALAAFWQQIVSLLASPWLRLIAVVLLLIAGFMLYIARTYLRALYGLAEILIGLAACWAGLSNQSNSALSASLAVAGGLYIIVRGFDNIIDEQSLLEKSKKPKDFSFLKDNKPTAPNNSFNRSAD